MLRGPIANIRLAQISYGILIFIFLTGSMLLVVNSINPITPTDSEFFGPSYRENISLDALVAGSIDPSSLILGILWALVPLSITSIIIAFYLPPISNLGLSKTLVQKEDRVNRFHLPARGYTIKINSVYIRVTRKLSSLKGLMLREMHFTVYLPLDYSDRKRIYDFLVGEKMKYTKTHVLLQKTVSIRNIPLLVVRTRAILGISNINKNS
ncbi:MAG: hypothetical protein ACXABG_07435 [Promethearchaeota archaeon]|jgi:hypothetical protein